MAIEAHYGDAGRSLWDEWSLTAKDKYDKRDKRQDLEVTQGQRRRHRHAISLCQAWRMGGWYEKLYEEWCQKQAPRKMMSSTAFRIRFW